jgi:glycine/sarcosine N-methyltransferase
MYNTFSSDYDRFVNWPARLAFELPFLKKQILGAAPREKIVHVLDTACGTGMHVIALAKDGFSVDGADLSVKMVEKARENALKAGILADFRPIGFGRLAQGFSDRIPYDAVLCLGNSLPHLTDPKATIQALRDFQTCLKPGGVLLIQNRNFDAVMAGQDRWMEPQSVQEGDREWIFIRFYDFRPDGLINFNILTLARGAGENWRQQVSQTDLYPLLQGELLEALKTVGFIHIECFGMMNGDPFLAATSGNLIVKATKENK